MRKYQQLILFVLTVLSFGILVMYKKENARLLAVLDVVNFFGKNDVDAILKLENSSVVSGAYDLGYPLASWQWIGGSFHAYSAFWKQWSQGGAGEVVAVTIGEAKAAVNFKCFVRFSDKGKMKGKFRFERIKEDSSEEFSVYKFGCKYESARKVVAVTFINVATQAEHTLLVRDLQDKKIKEKIHLAVCLDMTDGLDTFGNLTTIQEFFYHYHIIGAEEFVVYGTTGLTHFIRTRLLRHGIQPNVFPYNFPFETVSKNRAIVETDCLLRTSNVADFVIVVGPNEYLYPYTAKFKPRTDFYSFLSQYSTDISTFEVPTRSICMNQKVEILSDNNLAEVVPSGEKFFLHRPQFDTNFKSITLEAKRLSLNRYLNCSETVNIFDWRNLIDEQSLKYINEISHQLNLYLTQ